MLSSLGYSAVTAACLRLWIQKVCHARITYTRQESLRDGKSNWTIKSLSRKKAWLSHIFTEKYKNSKKVLDKPLKILYDQAVKKNRRAVEPFKVLKGVSR